MTRINTSELTPRQAARADEQLDKHYRFSNGIFTLRQWIEAQDALEKEETDGSMDYNRTRFNRMSHAEQRAYNERLAAKRYYFVNGVKVPKVVFDSVTA